VKTVRLCTTVAPTINSAAKANMLAEARLGRNCRLATQCSVSGVSKNPIGHAAAINAL